MQYMKQCGRGSQFWLGRRFSSAHLAKLGHKGEANPAYRHDLPDEAVLAEMYQKAGSVSAVARLLGCSHRAVARRLKTVGVRLRTLSEIASERVGIKNPFFGKHHSLASRDLMSASLQGNIPPNFRHDITPNQVAEMYATGLTGAEIAERLNCEETLVYRRLQRAGIPRRSVAA